jgi:hypothetical protein
MKHTDEIWSRLTNAAQHANDDREIVMPTGFATRVVANAFSERGSEDSMLEKLAMRMMGVSCLIALFTVLTYFSVENTSEVASESDTLFYLEDPVVFFVGDDTHE